MSIKESFISAIKDLMANVQPKPDARGYYKYLERVESDLIEDYSSRFEELATYDGLEIPKVDDASVLEGIKEKLRNNTKPELIDGLCVGVDCTEYLYCEQCIFSKDNRSALMRYLGIDPKEPQVQERPKKQEPLPEWCEVDATCYDYGAGKYFKVTGIDAEKAEVSISWYPKGLAEVISYSLFKEYAKPARKRQFNEQEILDLVGKVLSSPDGKFRSLILWAHGSELITYYRLYNANTLMADGHTVDGKPCYVLEHLNEKGEWVE